MLKIDNLFVQYCDSQKPSVQNVSFEVERGDHVAILGPSGVGKSTTLKVIAGLLDDEAEISGIITWKNDVKPNIKMVFQEAILLPWRTVYENIFFVLENKGFSKKEMDLKIDGILKIVGLSEYYNNYPYQLSVGMKQRVNFARALVCEPELLLLDEPFSSIDEKTKMEIIEQFSEILRKKNITSVFVTHSKIEAEIMANKIVILGK